MDIQILIPALQQNTDFSGRDARKFNPERFADGILRAFGLDHDWSSTVFPFVEKWKNEYGPIFVYSTGNIQMVCVTDTEMVKELSICTSLSLGKPVYHSKERGPILGNGILSSSGLIWAHQRKIIAPEFYLDKVKGMMNLMVESTTSLVGSWESRVESEGGTAEIRVDMDLRRLAADIISRACFGSSYLKGQEIFSRIRSLQKIMSKGMVGVPGMRYLPTRNNREIWKLEKEINSMILKLVKQRSEASYEKDLLQMMLESAKTSWALLLLAEHPEWQERVRAEVTETCRNGLPDVDMLPSLKILTMVIQETLRLYPPIGLLPREVFQDIKFKDIVVPKGMGIRIPIAIVTTAS
ncbi:putative Cytochrome P450 [Melia azedarach]|uniref:Cytochrome P450 n=1 Tax=Melia azedarach TaxID=155640 RepID=A0ACC1YV14_MELAZ|nr:putative Cytochrome P450 [Melia azedarach]